MYLHAHSYLDAHRFQLFTEFISKSFYKSKDFCRVAIDDLSPVEEKIEPNLFFIFNNLDIQEGK